jgi:uncharacterized protein YjeT (DUF2065 family)
VKRLGLAVGLLITAAGILVTLVPSAVIRFAQHGVTAVELYASAITRVGIGVLFLLVAPMSRLPRLLRVFGMIAVMAGIVTPFLGVARAQAIADWVSHQGLSSVRAFGLLALAIGAAILYACGPRRMNGRADP